jgi:HlyD family secretion protein
VVTYPVIIMVDNPDLALRPNMTANVTIDVATVRDVLRIPNGALRFRPEEKEGGAAAASRRTPSASTTPGAGPSPEERAARGTGKGPAGAMQQFDRTAGGAKGRKAGQTIYELGADGEPKPVDIRTGITDGRFTEVVAGNLKAGDTVIVGLVTAKADASAGRPPGGPGRRF